MWVISGNLQRPYLIHLDWTYTQMKHISAVIMGDSKRSSLKIEDEASGLVGCEEAVMSHPLPKPRDMYYSVNENPPWPMTVFLGFQHYVIMFVSTAVTPMIFASAICLPVDGSDLSDVINTLMFVSGVTTIIQTTVGVRLPIVQGGSFAYVFPLLAIMAQPKWQCSDQLMHSNTSAHLPNDSHSLAVSFDEYGLTTSTSSADAIEVVPWKSRMREIQGAVLTASLFQVLAGATGLMQGVLRYIGPLTIAPTITIIGLGLFDLAAEKCSLQWGVAILLVVLMTVFSQYMSKVRIPCFSRCSKPKTLPGLHNDIKYPIFSMLSVLFSILLAWLFCFVLTISGAIGDKEHSPGYHARTDINTDVISSTAWFRVPYPGQWGTPTFSISSTLGMLSGVLASMVESIGDYYACARASGAPPPPNHAVNRGLLAEGLGGILSGLMGTGIGSTSFSQNIAAISITKVGSLRVVKVAGAFMLVMSMFGKFSAIFVTIPTPILGGLYLVMFGMVTAVGLSNLHYVDLSRSRNLYILGISILAGLSIPYWVRRNTESIKTGVDVLDQILVVLLTTGMFLAGLLAFVLDNTIPGTNEERGILGMKAAMIGSDGGSCSPRCYDIPFTSRFVERFSWTKYLPFCHNYEPCACHGRCGRKRSATISRYDTCDADGIQTVTL